VVISVDVKGIYTMYISSNFRKIESLMQLKRGRFSRFRMNEELIIVAGRKHDIEVVATDLRLLR